MIAVPGYCALIGDIKNGETITLDGIEADSVRDFGNWSAAEDLPEIEKNYLDGVIYNHMPNRSDNCLFFGKLAGNDDTFQLDSGYEAYGISYYYQEPFFRLLSRKPARRMGPRSGISMESLSCTIFRRERMMKFPTGRSILRVIRRWRRSM